MKIDISDDTAEQITTQVLVEMAREFPELKPHIKNVLEYIMVHSKFKEWQENEAR